MKTLIVGNRVSGMTVSYLVIRVVQFCVLSLAALEKMLRPIGPTLSVPIELPEAFSSSTKFVRLLNGNTEKRRLLAEHQPNDSGPSHPDGSPDQPEINPLLVDAEMSEFDFLHSGQDEAFGDQRVGAGVADSSPEISAASEIRLDTEASDESPVEISDAGNDRLTYEESKTSPTEIITHSNGEVYLCGSDICSEGMGITDKNDYLDHPDVSAKRKPLPEPAESPAPKKTKSVVTDITSLELGEKISVEVAIDPVSEIPSDSSVAQTVVPKTIEISTPENDLEEEMLRSFVDVVD